ncbi:hypothetical protein DFJ73DRAFT_956970 [Zopfochytrium polystomum]|nr:hypothetical protein DFJ73DRAFT_956970 [Zopfochytrium polystomum]
MKILIVGGGIGGPAVALMLKRYGHDVELFDRVEPFAPAQAWVPADVGGALNLQENVLRILERLGLLAEVLAAGIPVPFLEMRRFSGDVIARFAIHNREPYVTTDILRSTLTRILNSAMNREGVVMKTGKTLVDVRQELGGGRNGGVTAVFADGTVARGDILIGADGVHSHVRRALFPDVRARQSNYVGYVGVSEYNPGIGFDTASLNFLMDNKAGKMAYMMRASETRLQWAIYETRPDEIGTDDWEGYKDLGAERARIAEMARRWNLSDWFRRAIVESVRIIPVTFWIVEDVPLWHKGNVVLMGDAVHAMLPFAGQGAAMAIEDAAVLATALTYVPDDPLAAFRVYQELRKQRATAVSKTSEALAKNMNATTPFAAFVGHSFLKMFAMYCRFSGANIISKNITDYDAYATTIDYLTKEGFLPAV